LISTKLLPQNYWETTSKSRRNFAEEGRKTGRVTYAILLVERLKGFQPLQVLEDLLQRTYLYEPVILFTSREYPPNVSMVFFPKLEEGASFVLGESTTCNFRFLWFKEGITGFRVLVLIDELVHSSKIAIVMRLFSSPEKKRTLQPATRDQ
jgi:hypothetical protein